MASKFYVWINDGSTGGKIQSPATYADDAQRSAGFASGTTISSIRVNTALRQSSLVVKALMDIIDADGSLAGAGASVEDVTNLVRSWLVDASNLDSGKIKMKLLYFNGNTSQSESATTFYAPSTSGTANQILRSNGAGNAPTWFTIKSTLYGNTADTTGLLSPAAIYKALGKLNGSAITIGSDGYGPSIYAPVFSGSIGTYLQSNGANNAPVWFTKQTRIHNGTAETGAGITPDTSFPDNLPITSAVYAALLTVNNIKAITNGVGHSIYAPTNSGSVGQFLMSNGNAAPIWVSLYMPLTIGSNGQVIESNGTTAQWVDFKFNLNGTNTNVKGSTIYAPVSSTYDDIGKVLISAGDAAPIWKKVKLYRHNIILSHTQDDGYAFDCSCSFTLFTTSSTRLETYDSLWAALAVNDKYYVASGISTLPISS